MKSTRIIVIVSVLFMMGCAHYIENATDSKIILPTVKDLPVLIYPKQAQLNNYTGNTSVQLFISKSGNVIEAKVLNSSGYAVLDNAAKDYCEKITFYPASANGLPINSRSIVTVKFDLSNEESFGKTYILEIKKLYKQIPEATELEKYYLQKDILMKHEEFIGNTLDEKNCNKTILKVLSNDIAEEWEAYVKYCPLTFLVYHDFLTRFPDYKNASDVKIELKKTVELNIKTLESISVEKFDSPMEKENLLLLIKNYVQRYYPYLINSNAMNQTLNS